MDQKRTPEFLSSFLLHSTREEKTGRFDVFVGQKFFNNQEMRENLKT